MNGYTLSVIDQLMGADAPPAAGHFHDLVVGSGFQPIFSLAHARVVGHEALLRATDRRGKPIPPPAAFDRAAQTGQSVLLDRLCRRVHLENFARQSKGQGWLFLNVDRESIQNGPVRYGPFFRDLLATQGVPGHRIVIEIMESSLDEGKGWPDSIHLYRELGCLLAIDDFGAGQSNFDRIWRFKPEIVKLDISLVRQASRDPLARQMLMRITSALHEAGALVLVEGVEDEAQALIAMEADADFVQGFYFGRPSPQLAEQPADGVSFTELVAHFHRESEARRGRTDARLAPYLEAINGAARLMMIGLSVEAAVQRFLALPLAEVAYLVDGEGYQLSENILAPGRDGPANPRLIPVSEALGANWSRRPYFQRAMGQPGTVQVTRPYLSLASGQTCVTVSTAFQLAGDYCVLCADVAWPASAAF